MLLLSINNEKFPRKKYVQEHILWRKSFFFTNVVENVSCNYVMNYMESNEIIICKKIFLHWKIFWHSFAWTPIFAQFLMIRWQRRVYRKKVEFFTTSVDVKVNKDVIQRRGRNPDFVYPITHRVTLCPANRACQDTLNPN